MCGIAGFLNYNLSDSFFKEVNPIQRHRGPDNQGSWKNNSLGLFHQRLSIIDLSEGGNQPFEKNGLVIVFNGEIYNYKELRERLESTDGVVFRSGSDTEVLLELYRKYGEKCLNQLRGMFAFAVYNISQRELFIARDPFGIKPLFYTGYGQKFAFSSELKTLLKSPGFLKNINQHTLLSSINYLWVPGNDTMFESCQKLPAGHFIKVKPNGQYELKQYYQLDMVVEHRSEKDWIEKLDSALQNSISAHMESDVPVSAFLSGGLDSSLLSVLAGQKIPISTYSISISEADKKVEKMSDDAAFARKLAKAKGFDHHDIRINPDIASHLPFIVNHLDEPIGDPAAINTYLICEAAKKAGSKVLLSGMGADEIFFGYRRQQATLLALKYQKLPGALRSIIGKTVNHLPVKIGKRGLKLTRWAKRFLSFANLPPSDAYMRSYSYYDTKQLNELFNTDITHAHEKLINEHAQIFNSGYEGDYINQMCQTDVQMFMQGLNLTYTDRASMAASVEVRVPFIDKEIVELAMSIPGSVKFKKSVPKYILKKVAEKHLPKDIIYRPKASFGAPIRSWISGELSEMVGDLLNPTIIKERGYFNPKFVQKLISEDKKGTQDNAYQIYQLLTLELWMQSFIDS